MITQEFNLKTADGLNLFTSSWLPDGDARAIACLVHGLGEHQGRYRHVIAHLVNAGFGVLAFDLRGHGKSEGKRGTISSYDGILDDIAGLLREATNRHTGKPIFLYGHSLGGNLVINYALRRKPQLNGIISTSPGLRTAFVPPPAKLALGKLMYAIWPGLILASGLELKAISRDPRVVAAYQDDPLVHDRLSARLGVDILQTGEWVMQHAAGLNVPLLLLHGDADRITSCAASQEFARLAGEKCSLRIWPGGYHELHNEPEQKDVLDQIVQWMEARL